MRILQMQTHCKENPHHSGHEKIVHTAFSMQSGKANILSERNTNFGRWNFPGDGTNICL